MIVESLFTKRSENLVPVNATLQQRMFDEVEGNATWIVDIPCQLQLGG